MRDLVDLCPDPVGPRSVTGAGASASSSACPCCATGASGEESSTLTSLVKSVPEPKKSSPEGLLLVSSSWKQVLPVGAPSKSPLGSGWPSARVVGVVPDLPWCPGTPAPPGRTRSRRSSCRPLKNAVGSARGCRSRKGRGSLEARALLGRGPRVPRRACSTTRCPRPRRRRSCRTRCPPAASRGGRPLGRRGRRGSAWTSAVANQEPRPQQRRLPEPELKNSLWLQVCRRFGLKKEGLDWWASGEHGNP